MGFQHWTKDEDRVLVEMLSDPTVSHEAVAERLPLRSPNAVQDRARHLRQNGIKIPLRDQGNKQSLRRRAVEYMREHGVGHWRDIKARFACSDEQARSAFQSARDALNGEYAPPPAIMFNPAIQRAEGRILASLMASPKRDEAAAVSEINRWNQENPHARLRNVTECARSILAKLERADGQRRAFG